MVGETLKAHRKSRELSPRELATLAGVSHQTIRNIEAGADPKLSTLEKLEKALGAPLRGEGLTEESEDAELDRFAAELDAIIRAVERGDPFPGDDETRRLVKAAVKRLEEGDDEPFGKWAERVASRLAEVCD